MARKKKCPDCPPPPVPEYMATYGDMVTLLLCFFVLLYATVDPEAKANSMSLVLAAFQGLGNFEGGNTLSEGDLAELGQNVNSLISESTGKKVKTDAEATDAELVLQSNNDAQAMVEKRIVSDYVTVKEDERGLVITLASDAFFKVASAEVQIEETRTILQKIATLLSSPQFQSRYFKIEGHTDNELTDPDVWKTNWELASARALNVLHYLVQFGLEETRVESSSFGLMRPIASNETPEGRAQNRRVDIIILSNGNL